MVTPADAPVTDSVSLPAPPTMLSMFDMNWAAGEVG
jgi:hypothetical protein